MESKMNPGNISIQTVQKIIDYIDENILEIVTPNNIAEHFFVKIGRAGSVFFRGARIRVSSRA